MAADLETMRPVVEWKVEDCSVQCNAVLLCSSLKLVIPTWYIFVSAVVVVSTVAA